MTFILFYQSCPICHSTPYREKLYSGDSITQAYNCLNDKCKTSFETKNNAITQISSLISGDLYLMADIELGKYQIHNISKTSQPEVKYFNDISELANKINSLRLIS